METVQAMQALAGAVYLATITLVGVRLLLLARRTLAVPELLLGGALFLGGTLGGPLEAGGMAVRVELGGAVAGQLLLFGKIFGAAALTCHVVFIRRVFRPEAKWSAALAGALVACPLIAFGASAANGTFATGELSMFWFWVELVGRLGGGCWLVFEGWRYHGLMKKRLRLGLADPVVTNRFLLWTLAGVCSIVMFLASVPPLFLDAELAKGLLTLDLFAFSVAGVAVSVLYFLTFLPPESYCRRVRAAAEAVG